MRVRTCKIRCFQDPFPISAESYRDFVRPLTLTRFVSRRAECKDVGSDGWRLLNRPREERPSVAVLCAMHRVTPSSN